MSCLDLTTCPAPPAVCHPPVIQEIAKCAFEMSIGNSVIAAIVVFAFFLYGMHKLRIPFMVQVPVGLFILYVFAGGGIGAAVPEFQTIMLFAMMVLGAIIVLLFWRWRH